MADDPGTDSDTEELPSAQAAFEMRGNAREVTAGAVSRAAALLALVRPRKLRWAAFRDVTAEARAELEMETVEPPDDAAPLIEEAFASLGSTGTRATAVLRSFDKGADAEESWFSDFGIHPSEREVAQTIRAYSGSERELVELEQGRAAQELFGPEAHARQGQRQSAAIGLIAASVLDPDRLVQVSAAGAMLRLDPKIPSLGQFSTSQAAIRTTARS